MDHYKGISPKERYDNDLLNELRKNNQLLEQIAQLLQPQVELKEASGMQTKRPYTRRK